MSRKVNPNFKTLVKAYHNGASGVVLEGSSRSGKTWSIVDFLIYLTIRHVNKGTFNIYKETYNSFKTTLYEDFNRRLPNYGITSPFDGVQEKPSFWLSGSKFNFLGADKATKRHGEGCDFSWFNESMDIPKAVFDQAEMRTRRMWVMDYNPKFTDHWIYENVCRRSDIVFLKTTFLDNPFISEPEKRKILSYEPNEKNIREGTADEYMWKVYGLGERSARLGLIYPDVEWIDRFPDNIERVFFGMDFGYTNDPTAIVRIGVNGYNLYLSCEYYAPTPTFEILKPIYKAIVKDEQHCWADSADPAMIGDFRRGGMLVFGVNKKLGIKYGIDLMKRYKIHIVRSEPARKEQENYTWMEINGILINEPIDKYNHFWDAARYGCMSELRGGIE